MDTITRHVPGGSHRPRVQPGTARDSGQGQQRRLRQARLPTAQTGDAVVLVSRPCPWAHGWPALAVVPPAAADPAAAAPAAEGLVAHRGQRLVVAEHRARRLPFFVVLPRRPGGHGGSAGSAAGALLPA